MTNEELLEKLNQRFIIEREETKKILDQRFALEREETKKILDQRFALEREETRTIVREEVIKQTEPIRKDIKKLERKSGNTNKLLNLVAKIYNQEDVDLKKRVSDIEEHLGISDATRLI